MRVDKVDKVDGTRNAAKLAARGIPTKNAVAPRRMTHTADFFTDKMEY